MTPPDQPMDISNLGNGVTTIMAEMDRMRHEIARLRQVEQDRAARRAAREPIHSLYDILVQLSEENDDLIEERNRLRAILAMLREPSDDLIDAASRAFTTAMTGDGDWYAGDQWGSIAKALAAAVAAAEEEVGA